MSEALDRVRGVRELPLFPLPLVLFPGVPLPLHIFEERYRRLLADVRASNSLFGLSYFVPETDAEDRPPVGHVGCATEVVEVQPLPDGRSNILTLGVVRYRVAEYVERGDPYLVARVEFFEDEEEDAAFVARRAEEVTEMFTRIARAMRTINDERGEPPELPAGRPRAALLPRRGRRRDGRRVQAAAPRTALDRRAPATPLHAARARPSRPTKSARARTSWRAATATAARKWISGE